jgi:hypothetical protein
MPRRTVQAVDPLSAQSRTLALTSASDLQQLKSDFQSDKATQDSKISTLEADKISKDTQMTALDTRVTTMENSATGIVDGGRADVQHLEATDINGGSASI